MGNSWYSEFRTHFFLSKPGCPIFFFAIFYHRGQPGHMWTMWESNPWPLDREMSDLAGKSFLPGKIWRQPSRQNVAWKNLVLANIFAIESGKTWQWQKFLALGLAKSGNGRQRHHFFFARYDSKHCFRSVPITLIITLKGSNFELETDICAILVSLVGQRRFFLHT